MTPSRSACDLPPTYLITTINGEKVSLPIDVCQESLKFVNPPTAEPVVNAITNTTEKTELVWSLIGWASNAMSESIKPRLTSLTITGFLGAATYGLIEKSKEAFDGGNRKKGWCLLAVSVIPAAICAINISNFGLHTPII